MASIMKYFLIVFFVVIFSDCIFCQQKSTIDSLTLELKNSKQDTSQVKILLDLTAEYYLSDPSRANEFCERAREVSEKINFNFGLAESYGWLAFFYKMKGDILLALDYYKKSLFYQEVLQDKEGMASAINNIALIYQDQGDIQRALEFFQMSLSILEENKDTNNIPRILNNLAFIYQNQGDLLKALEYFNKALVIFENTKNKGAIAVLFNNMALVYQKQNEVAKALNYFNKSRSLYEEINDRKGISISLNNLGKIYEKQWVEKTEKPRHDDSLLIKAMEFYRKSLAIREEIKDKRGMAVCFINIGSAFLQIAQIEKGVKTENLDSALKYSGKALTISKELGFPEIIRDAANVMNKGFRQKKQWEKALGYYDIFITMRDSILNQETRKASVKKQLQYEFDKREAALKEEQARKEAVGKEESKRKTIFLLLVIALAAGTGVIAVIILRALKVARKQKGIIEEQKRMIEEKHKETTDSINYAKRLQQAILPPVEFIKKYLPESFLIYKPKDIVAGDFYWMASLPPEGGNTKTLAGSHVQSELPPSGGGGAVFIAAADCTGHGVPGALVSVVCCNALNRSVKEFGLRDTGKILDKVTDLVLETFSAFDKSSADKEKNGEQIKDGMDISLLRIEHFSPPSPGDKPVVRIQWSGANNPLWYFINNEFKEITANKQPVGKSDNRKPFTTHNIEVFAGIKEKESQVTFYLFTDGYPDQFGGPKGKKFKYKQLEKMLCLNNNLPLEEQKILLENSFHEWKSHLEQVDDITVIGIRV